MGVEDLTVGQWAYLLGLGVIGMVLHAVWAHREAVWAWAGAVASLVRPRRRADYVDDAGEWIDDNEGAFSAFERAERPQNVQPVQPPNGDGESADDITRIDCAARLLAAGVQGEAAAIELLFDGVRRGGSRRYQMIRDQVRLAAASRHGWKAPAPEPAPEPAAPRLVAISGGRGGYIDLDENDPPEPLP